MPGAGFEPKITASERANTVHALEHSVTVTGLDKIYADVFQRTGFTAYKCKICFSFCEVEK
jgi:hypothetical protein